MSFTFRFSSPLRPGIHLSRLNPIKISYLFFTNYITSLFFSICYPSIILLLFSFGLILFLIYPLQSIRTFIIKTRVLHILLKTYIHNIYYGCSLFYCWLFTSSVTWLINWYMTKIHQSTNSTKRLNWWLRP